ncbi:MAG: anti-sigma factor antagonist [Verrucomicrobiaceae bacterium]|nr:MAG: anti-sigma factor antagonist [Verrucomicrobiaceae bacterium]
MQIINLPSGCGNELKLSGEVDFHRSPRLRAALRVKLRERNPLLVLDCTELEYIDSCGMAALLEYVRGAREFGGRLAVKGLNPSLRSIFELVHLDQHLLLLS